MKGTCIKLNELQRFDIALWINSKRALFVVVERRSRIRIGFSKVAMKPRPLSVMPQASGIRSGA